MNVEEISEFQIESYFIGIIKKQEENGGKDREFTKHDKISCFRHLNKPIIYLTEKIITGDLLEKIQTQS
jgi:hypothetical protein